MRKSFTVLVLAPGVIVASLLAPGWAQEEQAQSAPRGPKVHWIESPTTADLGSTAEIQLGAGYVFANAADTRKLMEAMGNTVDDTEVGLVTPNGGNEDWLMVFEYHDAGYVKDDEKDEIDADALLDGITKGTEAANEVRKQRGIPGLHVTGWEEKPNYDPVTHNFQWAIRARDDEGGEVVNYNLRLLGRSGYMSVTLVDDPVKLAISKPKMKSVLEGFRYKKGSTYAEWVPGDKVAEYGLAALVAGGAGVAASKAGLFAVLGKFFAKAGKAAILLVVAVLAGIKKLISMLMGRRSE
jgi:uncharacterized membrane-anchored protein